MRDVEVNINFSGITDEEYVVQQARQQAREHNMKGRQSVEDLIELSLKTKTLITLVENQFRGFGKTEILARKADELGATLIVPRHVKEQFSPSYEFAKCYVSLEQVKGVRLKTSGFIVDEGVDPLIIKELSIRHEFLGGFSRL